MLVKKTTAAKRKKSHYSKALQYQFCYFEEVSHFFI